MSTVVVKGISIENPTRVWHELMNSRERLEQRRWNSRGWFEPGEEFTMCLANVIRWTVKGSVRDPGEFSRRTDAMDQAEALVLACIQERYGEHVEDIPQFNDATTRTYKDIVESLDWALEAIKPFAFTHTITIAANVMTDEEKRQMQDAYAADLSSYWSFKKPKRSWWSNTIVPAITGRRRVESNPVVDTFNEWLDSFEVRGWDSFWKELAECDTEECEEARRRLLNV